MAKRAAVSIKQLARMANLSIATISRVINNNGRFSEETRDLVKELIRKTGYTPNVAAKALRTKTARAIGLVIPDIHNEFFLQIVNSVEKFFFANDYSLFVCNTGEDKVRNRSLIQNLLGKGVDGLIYISRFPLETGEFPIPTVCLDRDSDQSEGHAMVSSDNLEGGRLAARALVEAGSKRPVVVYDRSDYVALSSVHDRVTGFAEVLAARGVPFSRQDVILTPATIPGARRNVRKVLESGRRFDGLFGASDLIAMGSILALRDCGFCVPEDVNVVGYDDISFSEYFTPALSTIHQDTAKLGTTSAKTLLSIMANKRLAKRHITVPVRLVLRGSTRGAPAARTRARHQ